MGHATQVKNVKSEKELIQEVALMVLVFVVSVSNFHLIHYLT